MAEVTFIGTGEACDPELPNTSILYSGGSTLLLDCGYSVPQALWGVLREPSAIDAIFVSHTHADHTFGLPALLLWMRDSGRRDPLIILGSHSVAPFVEQMVELAYPGLLRSEGMFPVEVVEVWPGKPYELGALVCLGAVSDHGEHNLALRIEEGGRAVCYSGDGAMTEDSAALFRGADLLVHECYLATPKPSGHADVESLLAAADSLGISQLSLVHLGRSYRSRIGARVAACAKTMRINIPSPGDSVSLPHGARYPPRLDESS